MISAASPHTATSHEGGRSSPVYLDRQTYREKVALLCEGIAQRFRRAIHLHALFHLSFALVGLIELLLFSFLLPVFVRSSLLAVSLAALFLTCFGYFSLRLYLAAKKPERISELKDLYLYACRNLLGYQEGVPEHHLALASSATKLASELEDGEYLFYEPPRLFRAASASLEKLSCFLHWRDVLSFREQLLFAAIDEQIRLVKCEPTSLEVHAALANTYVMLSGVYLDPRKAEGSSDDRFVPPARSTDEMKTLFLKAAERAIEEFKILCAYAPNDPWVHAQLAYSYRDLQMPKEEIGEYEIILELRPDDHDTRFKLGMRYFQCGLNAKGLQVYEQLKRVSYKKVDDLIAFYGAYAPPSFED